MKIERLIGILSILLQREKVTAPFLAEKFEVSRRTINRDVEELCLAGIPVVTEQGANGGISIISDYKFDRTLLTNKEMQAVLAGLKSLDSISGGSRYQQLMDKLCVRNTEILSDNQHIVIDLASWDTGRLAPRIEFFQNAVESRRVVTFLYYAPGGTGRRTVEPYLLVFRWQAWYVWCYCRLREEFRLFKLSRMGEPELLEEQYTPREIEELEEPFPKLAGGFCIRAAAEFDAAVKWRLVEEFGLEQVPEECNGKIIMEFSWYDELSLFDFILSFGTAAKLLKPEPLKNRFIAKLEQMRKEYK